MPSLSREELIQVREILLNLEGKYPEVLYDGILVDMDLANEPFEELMKNLERVTDENKTNVNATG